MTDLGDVMLCKKKSARELHNGQAHCRDEAGSARSVILNATVTQYASSVNGVSLPAD